MPGLRNLTLLVNGQPFAFPALTDGRRWQFDIASAMQPGEENVVVLIGEGPPGGSAEVTIGDARSDAPEAVVAMDNPFGLRAERVGDGMGVSWSASASGWILESSTVLGVPGSWHAWSGKPTLEGGRYRVTLPAEASAQLFRLTKP